MRSICAQFRILLSLVGVISGALLYIRDEYRSVDRSTVLQVCIPLIYFISCQEQIMENLAYERTYISH